MTVKRNIDAAVGRRVYTYTDEQGNVFWSFYRSGTIILPPQRFYLRGRVGQHIINFLVSLRRKVESGDG